MTVLRFILSLIASALGIILIVPIVIVMSPFWLISIAFKMIHQLGPEILDWKDTNGFDQDLGWRPKPNLDAYMETDSVYHLTTGKDGWRGNYTLENCDTIVIGDSFAFGKGVDDNDHFANLTQSSLVKPMGAPGYGIAHYLLILKSLTKELKKKSVIWLIYTGNDLREGIRPNSYGKKAPFIFYNHEKKTWEIETGHITPERLPFNSEKGYKISMPELADLFSKNYLSDYAYAAFEFAAKEAQTHCQKYGAKFIIITTPIRWFIDGNYAYKLKKHSSNQKNFSASYPDEQMQPICERLGINFKSCRDCFTLADFLPRDLHWSRRGHEKIARIIDEINTLDPVISRK